MQTGVELTFLVVSNRLRDLGGHIPEKLENHPKSTRLHPQGKGGPEGDFLCAVNTYHTYHDVTIQNPSIIDLA